MNPVDHPHGGRTNKGGHPKTPTGFLAKGVKTRKVKIWSKKKIYSSKTNFF
jgi:large subunit ribosomal protein L2